MYIIISNVWLELTCLTQNLKESMCNLCVRSLVTYVSGLYNGEKVLSYFLPRSWQPVFEGIRRYSPYILLFLVFIGPRLGFDLIGKLVHEPVMAIARFLINW